MASPVKLRDKETLLIIQMDAKVNKKTGKSLGFQAADE